MWNPSIADKIDRIHPINWIAKAAPDRRALFVAGPLHRHGTIMTFGEIMGIFSREM